MFNVRPFILQQQFEHEQHLIIVRSINSCVVYVRFAQTLTHTQALVRYVKQSYRQPEMAYVYTQFTL